MQPKPEDLSALCELVGVASLCSWTVCLAVGLGLCAPDRALLLGIPGTLLGGLFFRYLGWPMGPTVDGYPILPALVGTTLMLVVTAYTKRMRNGMQHRKDGREESLHAFRNWPDDPDPARTQRRAP